MTRLAEARSRALAPLRLARGAASCRLGRHRGVRGIEFKAPHADGFTTEAVVTETCLRCGRLLDFWWDDPEVARPTAT